MHARKSRRFLLLLWAAGATLAAASEGRAQMGAGRIEGVVSAGGEVVRDADVSIPELRRRVRTDTSGQFRFENVPAGRYVVEAISPQWGRTAAAVRVRGGETEVVELVLEAVYHLDELVVSAGVGATRRTEAYQPASVVTSRELVATGEASLGETLSGEPGVSSTYFGPGASRPLIRGIGGDRVRILEGGIGVGDASSTSPDHAVGLETRTAERIEIIRGPATLLYGSSAVGGVVNVLDGRIAREPPTERLSGFVEGVGGTVADERTGTASLTARRGPLVLTASGLRRSASDYRIPDVDEPGTADEDGLLDNTSLDTERGSVGLTVVGDRGYIGAAWTEQASNYGIPAAAGDPERVRIDLGQTRYDLEGALRFGSGVVRGLKVRAGATDYRHVELEGEEVGTEFLNDYREARIESDHALTQRLRGALGVQLSSRDFEARGAEAFVPPSETRTVAAFAYEEFAASDALRLQGGLRWERQDASSPATGVERADDAVSLSAGASWDATRCATVALAISRSVKLPNPEELFSNGPHAATGAYEVGDPALGSETALGFDLTTHLHGERYRASASLFTTGFADYIYERATGEVRDGLPVFAYVQDDARFSGFEAEAAFDVLEGDGTREPHLAVELLGDFVVARLTDDEEHLPRIPPLRLGAGLDFHQGRLAARGSIRRTMRQDRTAPLEQPTPGFTMADASVSYRIFTGAVFHDITLVGTNLLDSEARVHTSFLKEVAPLPGREIRLVYRVNF